MKNIFLLFILSATGMIGVSAQPNPGFETWGQVLGAPEEPADWFTANVLASPLVLFPNPNDTSVWKVSGTDAHSGMYAMKIITIALDSNPDPANIPDTFGIALTGMLNPPPNLIQGFPYTSTPANFEFWYKYNPVSADTAASIVILTRWNGTSRDTIATGWWFGGATVNTYTLQQITLTYNPAFPFTNPDTAVIQFLSSLSGVGDIPFPGSAFYVDDIAFTGTFTGTTETNLSAGVLVFPNPASDHVTISVESTEAKRIEVYDVTGRLVSSSLLNSSHSSSAKKSVIIPISAMCNGIYSYRVVGENKKLLRAGKFNVVR